MSARTLYGTSLCKFALQTRRTEKEKRPGDRRRGVLHRGRVGAEVREETAGPRPGRRTEVGGVSEAGTDPQRVAPSRSRRPPAGRGRRVSRALGRLLCSEAERGVDQDLRAPSVFLQGDVGLFPRLM